MDAGFVELDGAQTGDATRANEAVRSQGLADALLKCLGLVFRAVVIGAIAMGSVAAVSPSCSLDNSGAR